MADKHSNAGKAVPHGIEDDKLDLIELVQDLWQDRRLIASAAILFGLSALTVSLCLPNVYQASALLKPQNSEGGLAGLGGLARQYGGLASLAGISLPQDGGESKTALAIEVLKSKRFAYEFADRHNVLPAIFAAKKWDLENEVLHLDQDIYDESSGTWKRDVELPRQPKPSPEELHEIWTETINVSEDKETGFVTISVKHISPIYAKEWLESLILDINESLRANDLAESERAITYLEEQLKSNTLAEIRELLAGLLRSHLESRMMATVESNYVFSVIDPPTIPEQKTEPKRPLICLLSAFLGAIIGIMASVVKKALRTEDHMDN